MDSALSNSGSTGFYTSIRRQYASFVDAIAGKSWSESRTAKTAINRCLLEHLAQFSSRYADELSNLRLTLAVERHRSESTAFCTMISPESRRSLARSKGWSVESQKYGQSRIDSLLEGEWEPSKHPRVPAGQPSGGQWTKREGGEARARHAIPVARAVHQGSPGRDAEFAAWLPPVGHHFVNVATTMDADIRPLLSDDAVHYALGAYSGPTSPPHGNTTLGDIKHPQYNGHVKKELEQYIKDNGISKAKKMTGAQMEDFVGKIENGLGANGKAHPAIGAYNKGVKAIVRPDAAPPTTMQEVLAAGKKYKTHSRFTKLVGGAIVSTVLFQILAQQADAMEVAASSGHYRQALAALEDGDLDRARRLLTDETTSLYIEILLQVGAHAALNYKSAMEAVFRNVEHRDYK